jgi:hypothetical protein
MDFQLDHGNIDSLRHLFSSYSRKALETMKTLTLAEQEIPRFPSYSTWAVFKALEEVDLHGCGLETVPGVVIVQALPGLRKLNLSRNRLTGVGELLALGKLKRLGDLNLLDNPIPFVTHRNTLIQSLLFPLTEIRFKFSKYSQGEYRQSAFKPTSTPHSRRTKSYTGIRQFLRFMRKPDKLPRPGRFPMLGILNDQVITEDEVKSAKPYREEEIMPPAPHSRTATSTPLQLRSLQLTRKSHHDCCLIRKARLDAVPRFIKIPEYFGEAGLSKEIRKKVEVIKKGKIERIRQMPKREEESQDSCPPSVAAEEDTQRRSSLGSSKSSDDLPMPTPKKSASEAILKKTLSKLIHL